MARRGNDGEIGFGSDSFLDIIANIVGILIILIVVAGVRVSQAPLVVETADDDEPEPVATVAAVPSILPDAIEPDEDEIPIVAVVPRIIEPDPVEPEPREPRVIYVEPDPIPVDASLEERIRTLRIELTSLDTGFEDAKGEYRTLDARSAALRTQLSNAEADLDEQRRRVSATTGDLERLESALSRTTNLVIDLRKEVQQEEATEPDVAPLRHETTAVSRIVDGKELHFRLAGNRIAAIPLEDLLAQLGDEVRRQKDWLVKFREHQGVVGPIDGVKLAYAVQRSGLSVMDRLQGQPGLIRIGVTRWEIEPTDQLVAENYREAMRPGSRFRQALGRADADTTLTFWTYPDSFELYRQLQAAAHANDFRVAGRPLPEGVPIAGSPTGTRSAGQ